jgi:2-methylcitrate dehydratase PrpD
VNSGSVERLLAAAARESFIRHPSSLDAIARRHLVDCAGVALAGAAAPAVVAIQALMPDTADAASARPLGTKRRMCVRDAASVNGIAAHFHDYDDDDPALSVGHPTAPVFAAICALADTTAVSMDTAIAAYVAGVETTMRIGRVVNPQHYNAGFHATATLGIFGASVASGLLLDLDARQIEHALGIAASLSAGLKCNFGSDVKPLQVGLAAGNAVFAAQLARSGVRSAAGALFGPAGFCTVHGGNGDARAVIANFGKPYGLEQPGLNIKVYPCCSSAHTAVDGLLEILHDDRVAIGDIESIDVWIGPDVPAMLIYDVPRTPLEAKFSMRYCIAAAARHGNLGLDAFTPEALADPQLLQLQERVRVTIDPGLPAIPTGVTHCSRVRVNLRNSATRERQIADPLGSPVRPIPRAVLRGKFVRCATAHLGAERAADVFDAWEQAPGDAKFSDLLDQLGATSTR